MTRPSRGDRRSATTTRQTGSFFPPTRVRRMETDIAAQEDSGGDYLCRISWPRSGIFPELRPFIILRISPNCLTSWLTCWTVVPEPLAMRRRREPLISSGRRRSSGVIERMIASTRSSSRSSTCSLESWWPARPGIIPSSEVSGPILRIRLSWSRKSSSVNWFLRSFFSSAFASSSSTDCSAFSMNDMSFIEKAEQSLDEDEAKALEKKLRKNQFTLEDFLDQLKRIRKMGPLTSLLGMIPGLAGHQLSKLQVDERELDRVEAIILSMTPEERHRPELIKGSRRLRIAKGSGTTVQQVNQLVKQFGEMRKMMKGLSSGKLPDLGQLMRQR